MIVSHQAEKVYSVEIVQSASEDNAINVEHNQLTNIETIQSSVEDFLVNWKNNQ